MADDSKSGEPSKARIIVAFLAIYIVWGSTYLAIRFAVETIPPFLMAGTRFLIAGSLLYVWMRVRGTPRPSRAHWRSTAIIGVLLLVLGNGGVTWAEQMVPSGITALLVATVPLWIVLLDWLWHGAARPSGRMITGLAVGMAGAGILSGPGHFAGATSVNPVGALALMIATISWSAGSLYSRNATLPSSPFLSTAMEMLAGGVGLAVLGIVTGELSMLHPVVITERSLLSLGYLVVFGSLVGFSAYVWLLRVVPAARVATYAYVNPVIALVLGWVFAGEVLTARSLMASVIIIAAVFMIVTGGSSRR